MTMTPISILLVALAAGSAAAPAAPARADLDALLARPVSPGVIALLVPFVRAEPRAAGRVIAALADADPAVRAAAARVVYVAGIAGAFAAVRSALAVETDRSAAVEALRASVLLGGPDGESDLLPLAQKHGLVRQLTEAAAGARMRPPSPSAPGAKDEPYQHVLIAAGLPPGMLRDVLAVAGCKAEKGLRAAALVDYRPDGRPAHVTMAEQKVSSGCARAAVPALALTLAPFGLANSNLPARRTVVIVPLDRDALDCADQPEPEAVERVADSDGPGAITEPRKVKNVFPQYPMAARETGRQGTVLLEAIIAESGCIRSIRVLRDVSPELDAAAISAVGGWRYTPSLRDGKPVSVIMAITVNFSLSEPHPR